MSPQIFEMALKGNHAAVLVDIVCAEDYFGSCQNIRGL